MSYNFKVRKRYGVVAEQTKKQFFVEVTLDGYNDTYRVGPFASSGEADSWYNGPGVSAWFEKNKVTGHGNVVSTDDVISPKEFLKLKYKQYDD